MKLILIGPRSVGKSTISKLLAKKLSLAYMSSDGLMQQRLKEYGGFNRVIKAGKKILINREGITVVQRVLQKNNFILDLAGGAVSSEIAGEKIQKIISNCFIISLIPSEDDKKSLRLLLNREKVRPHFKDITDQELREKVRKDYLKLKPILKKISQLIIFTQNKSPQKIVNEILARLPAE